METADDTKVEFEMRFENAHKILQSKAVLHVATEILHFAEEQGYDDDVLIQACKVIGVAPM